MTTTRIRRCGEAALLLDCADLAGAVTLARRLDELRLEAVDVVPAAKTVLVTARDAHSLPSLRRRVEDILATPAQGGAGVGEPAGSGSAGSGSAGRVGGGSAEGGGGEGGGARARTHTLAVRYDGPDLADVAELAGISPEELVRRHTQVTWRAAFGGFAPGFAYLVDDREVEGQSAGRCLPAVPRLASPRATVPAGSVGLADRFCAVYPGASPGGWRLLGTTDATLWDVDREYPALVAPGDIVRFRDVGGVHR